jgi:hypothetical protein
MMNWRANIVALVAGDDSRGGLPDRYLKVKDICRFLGISKSTFYRLLADESSGLGAVVVELPCVDGPRALVSRLREWADRPMQPRKQAAAGSQVVPSATTTKEGAE